MTLLSVLTLGILRNGQKVHYWSALNGPVSPLSVAEAGVFAADPQHLHKLP